MLSINAETNAPPLTEVEIKWLKRFNKMMSQCPTRFGFTTTGGWSLDVVDEHASDEAGILIQESDHIDAGMVLADVSLKNAVHGLCG